MFKVQNQCARRIDPVPGLDRAVADQERALALNPAAPLVHNSRGLAYLRKAEERIARGESAAAELRHAFEGCMGILGPCERCRQPA